MQQYIANKCGSARGIKGAWIPKSVIHFDGWGGYHRLVNMDYKKYNWGILSESEFARGRWQINGIENFWDYTRTRLSHFIACGKTTSCYT